MSTISFCHGNGSCSDLFFFLPLLNFFLPQNGGNINGGGPVEERDRGPSCREQFVFYPSDREGQRDLKAGYRVNLFCDATSLYGGCKDGACTVKRVGPVRMSTKHPTMRDCLRALLARIQQDHGSDCVAAVQAWQAASSAAESTKRDSIRWIIIIVRAIFTNLVISSFIQ